MVAKSTPSVEPCANAAADPGIWVARDSDGSLWLYRSSPVLVAGGENENEWEAIGDLGRMIIDTQRFPDLPVNCKLQLTGTGGVVNGLGKGAK